jgi:hypothetical protein
MRRLVCAILWLVALAPARAAPLPPPTTAVSCTDVTVVAGLSSCILGGASASLSLLPFAGEQVQASAPATDPQTGQIFGAGAVADIQYAFAVVGGHAGDVVPVLFSVNLDAAASSTDHANGFASIFVHTGQGDTQVCVGSTGFGCPMQPFAGTFKVFATSGDLGNAVNLEVSADAGDSPVAQWARASADPRIVVDPSFAGVAGYTVELSPGVGNALPVPEPPASLLWVAGGWLLWRRRPHAPSQPAIELSSTACST